MVYYETTLPVRYYETDGMGVVHHSNYIRYFECARLAFMEQLGYSIVQCEADGVTMPVVSVECRYLHPARLGDVLTVTVEIDRLPGARLFLRQRVLNAEGRVCAEGRVTAGFLDKETGRVVRCPRQFAELIGKRMESR